MNALVNTVWDIYELFILSYTSVCILTYSQVSNRRGNIREGSEKLKTLMAEGVGIVGRLEKIESLNSRGNLS